MNSTPPACEIIISCDCADHNKTDKLLDLLRRYAQEENLSARIAIRMLPDLILQCEDTSYALITHEIRYVISDGHYCRIQLSHGNMRLRIPFHKVVLRMQEPSARGDAASCSFLQISRGILVNLLHIKGHTRDSFLMDDGTPLLIRRSDRSRLIRAFDAGQLTAVAASLRTDAAD